MRGAGREGRMAQGIEGNSWPQRERGRMGAHKESLIVLLEVSMVPRKLKAHFLHSNLPNITPAATNVDVILRRIEN